MTFDTWWAKNKTVYLKAGIEEDVAAGIWNAAIQAAMISDVSTYLKKSR